MPLLYRDPSFRFFEPAEDHTHCDNCGQTIEYYDPAETTTGTLYCAPCADTLTEWGIQCYPQK